MSLKKRRTTIEVPSNLSYIKKVSTKIIRFLKNYNLSDVCLFNIRLCVEEALRNAIEHGNEFNKSIPIKVSFCIDDYELEISVEDRGKGFDFNSLPDPTTDENIMLDRGRGVFLIRHLMDEVSFSDRGNRITMKKKLNQGGFNARKSRK